MKATVQQFLFLEAIIWLNLGVRFWLKSTHLRISQFKACHVYIFVNATLVALG